MIKKILYIAVIIIGILGILNTIYVVKISVGLSAGNMLQGFIGIVFIIYAILKTSLRRCANYKARNIKKNFYSRTLCFCFTVFYC